MYSIKVRTTQNVFIHYPVASIGDRILAYLLDRIILVFYSLIVYSFLLLVTGGPFWMGFILLAVPWLFYSLLFEIFMDGQTPGKRLMQIKVVRLDGTPPTVGSYLMRWIFSFVDFYILSGAVAVVIISAGGRGQRLGDVVGGTSVVKLIEQKEISAKDIFVSADETFQPTFTQVIQLSERDIELIQQALEVNREHGNSQPIMVVTEKIKSLLGVKTDLPPVKFLYTVIKDFNHLTSK
jgi:uncharacterized RDD family membrane protein YckC